MTDFIPGINRGVFQHKFGYHPTMPNTGGDITPFGDIYWPDSVVAAADIDIASSDAADKGIAPAGAGAQAIKLYCLDEDYLEFEQTVILDGTDDVHPAEDCLRIYRAEVIKNAGAGAENVGNIVIDIGGTNTLAFIIADFGQTTQATYTIPAGRQGTTRNIPYKTGWLLDFDAGMDAIASGKFAQGMLMIRPFGGIWMVRHVFGITSEKDKDHKYPMNLEVPIKSDIRLRIFLASASNLFISASLAMYLER